VGPDAPVADLNFGNYAGLSISAYQLAYAYSVLVNGGRDPRTGVAVVRPDVSDFMRKALVQAVEEGTGTQAQCKGLVVGGKTGTSIRETEGKRTGTAYFVGFAPADNPRMVVSVIVDDVGSEINGNRHAASLFPEIVENGLPLQRKAADGK
jgi:cell division protein FtsI/penicillin-binding protein 2